MTPEKHSKLIAEEFAQKMQTKYLAGQKEHQDKLWELSFMETLNEIEGEIIDLANYIVDLKQKLKQRFGDEAEKRR